MRAFTMDTTELVAFIRADTRNEFGGIGWMR